MFCLTRSVSYRHCDITDTSRTLVLITTSYPYFHVFFANTNGMLLRFFPLSAKSVRWNVVTRPQRCTGTWLTLEPQSWLVFWSISWPERPSTRCSLRILAASHKSIQGGIGLRRAPCRNNGVAQTHTRTARDYFGRSWLGGCGPQQTRSDSS